MADTFDPLVPRPLDRPREVPLEPGADLAPLDDGKILAAPQDPADWPRWRDTLHRWRSEARDRNGYDGSQYAREDLRWAAGCRVVSQVWLWDELLYDAEEGRFTPERLVEDAVRRFGGFDGIVLWHAYPVIGLDERNQWDYYRLVPGLRRLSDDLHRLGVRVFLDFNPWDVGTRRGGPDAAELASAVADLDADGVFLDTLKESGGALLAALREARQGVAVEGESTVPLARVADHPLSWAQWFADSPVPGVVRSHWYERRHMMHHVRRWHRDHHEELQSAWLNGIGVMVWEVVFGSWVGWSERDALTLRRMSAAQRGLDDLLLTGEWTPLHGLEPDAADLGVYASTFAGSGQRLVAAVNRTAQDRDIAVPLLPEETGWATYDVWTGRRVDFDGRAVTAHVPAHGIGGILVSDVATQPIWLEPLRERLPTARFPHRRSGRVVPAASAQSKPEADHVVVAAGSYPLTVRYRCRETGMYEQAPFVDEWKPLPPRLHDLRTLDRVLDIGHGVAVAAQEIDERSFARFIAASGYAPRHTERIAPAWLGRPESESHPDRPVTEVGIEDARAYAAWAGARLPDEDEWQVAAGLPGWMRGTPLVWNLTESEHRDGRTRFLMLKGGSAYSAEGSAWYVDGGPQTPDFALKYLVPGLGLDRSPTVGFRVAWDLSDEDRS